MELYPRHLRDVNITVNKIRNKRSFVWHDLFVHVLNYFKDFDSLCIDEYDYNYVKLTRLEIDCYLGWYRIMSYNVDHPVIKHDTFIDILLKLNTYEADIYSDEFNISILKLLHVKLITLDYRLRDFAKFNYLNECDSITNLDISHCSEITDENYNELYFQDEGPDVPYLNITHLIVRKIVDDDAKEFIARFLPNLTKINNVDIDSIVL